VGKYIEKYYGIRADRVVYGGVMAPRRVERRKRGIVYVGRLESDTGLPKLLKLAEKLDLREIDFCGEGEMAEECRKYGAVHGMCDPRKYLMRAEECWAGGYLAVLEGIAYGCRVRVAWDNPLKKDYYALSPFGKWLGRAGKVEEARRWAMGQTWDKLTEEYLKLWGVI